MLCDELLEGTTLIMSAKHIKTGIRLRICKQRKHLPSARRIQCARQVFYHLKQSYVFRSSSNIAFYLAHDGELDPAWLMQYAQQQGKQIYLPALHPSLKNHLVFIRVHPKTVLLPNRYGILEPSPHHHPWLPAWKLDLVITPLVAFDKQGHRLGMGGGFYDRSFAFKRKNQRPWLVGAAYDFQQCTHLPFHQRDVNLDWVATPRHLIKF